MGENNNINNQQQINREDLHVDKNIKDKKNKHKIIIIISCVIITLLVVTLIAVLVITNKKSDDKEKTKEIETSKKITEKEFKAIVTAYGDAVTLASNNYMALNKGKIPTLDEIKDSIVFDQYKVSCETSKVNFDGSIYLANCKVDGKAVIKDYAYGTLKEESKKSGDKIYLYKYNNTYKGQDSVTKESVNTKQYFVSTYVDYQEGTLVDTYECYTKECKAYDFSDVLGKAIIYDGAYYLYNFNNDEKIKLDITDNNLNYINFVQTDMKVYGLVLYKESGKGAFYNLNSNKIITDYNYYNIYALSSFDGIFAASYEYTYLIDLNNGKILKSIKGLNYISEIHLDSDIYYQAYKMSEGPSYERVVLDQNLNTIIDYNYSVSTFNDNRTISAYKYNDNYFYIFDINGNQIYKSKEYKSILKIVRNYIIVLTKDDELVVVDTNDKIKANFLKVTDNYSLHPLLSGWYTTNGKNGIYFVVSNNSIEYGIDGSGLEYYYIPTTDESGVITTKGVGGYAKPVLYLYPTKKTEVTVTFEKPELLTTTYPKFNKSWKVTANNNGDLYDSKGKYYYGLYWEEEGTSNVDFSTGFYVDKENAINFLEEKLKIIGLNDRERNEFIMYWLPILEKNEHNLVYFELTQERESYNKLNIKPKPDSMLRLAIHVKKVSGKTYIKEQKLTKFKRKGFVAVEWGGVIHN